MGLGVILLNHLTPILIDIDKSPTPIGDERSDGGSVISFLNNDPDLPLVGVLFLN